MKKLLSAILALTVLALTPAFASASPENSVTDAARGLIQSQRDSYYPSGVSLMANGVYPEKFDLRAADLDGNGIVKNYVTPVKRQEPFGSCWSFSAIAAAETSILSEMRMSCDEWKETIGWDMDLSEHHLMWFANTPLSDDDNSGQGGEGIYTPGDDGTTSIRMNGGGASVMATSVFSSGIGPVREDFFPYMGKNHYIMFITPDGQLTYDPAGNEPSCFSPLDDWSIDEGFRYGQFFPVEESFLLPVPAQFEPLNDGSGLSRYVYNPAGTNAAKEQLMMGRPVQIGYCSSPSYINTESWAHYTPLNRKEDPINGATFNHAVAIIGWDDNYPKEKFLDSNGLPPADGAWIVKNSWGSEDNEFPNKHNWGDKGYFYLSYYDHTLSIMEALDFDTFGSSEKYYSLKYNYLPATAYGKYLIYDEPCYMANNFTAKFGDMILRTLTLQTKTQDTTTTFEVYKLNDSSTSPKDGELLASATKTFHYGGYHRVNLEKPVFLRSGERFSVVVTNKTADGKYEIVSDYNYSELTSRVQTALVEEPTYPYTYAKSVINEGESILGTTLADGLVAWNDWGKVVKESENISNDFLEIIDFEGLLTETEEAREKFKTAKREYYAAHPEITDFSSLPEELIPLYNDWVTLASSLGGSFNAIENNNLGYFDLDPEEIENFSDMAFFVRDNFPIGVIATPVEIKDYMLYFDSATSKLYSDYDFATGTFSNPVEIDGATCDDGTLTLTSDFQFATTYPDGLFLSEGSTLYIPKGERPSIYCGISGAAVPQIPLDASFGVVALGAYPNCALDIDGAFEVTSGDSINAINVAIFGYGDLEITGTGILTARSGNSKYDEASHGEPTNSMGIYTYGDLDISIANIKVFAGDSYSNSLGMVADMPHSITVSNGSYIAVQSGNSGNKETDASFGCAVMNLTVKDNSNLSISAYNTSNGLCGGLQIYSDESGGGKITLSDSSSLTVFSGSQTNSYGIVPYSLLPITAKMDSSCTFVVVGQTMASYSAELNGVIAVSGSQDVEYDRDKNSYIGADGRPLSKISFSPEYDINYDSGIIYVTAPTGIYSVIFATYNENDSLVNTEIYQLEFDQWGTQILIPGAIAPEAKRGKAMLWDSLNDMKALCEAAVVEG